MLWASGFGTSAGGWLVFPEEVTSHQDIVDVPTVEQELRSQGTFDLEATR